MHSFNVGETIYVNLENNETFEEFIQTIFHEFRHWVQFKIDKRPAASMISKRKKGWDMEQAELEAESWEKIGEKIADKRSPEGVRVCTILGVCTSSVGTLGGLNDWFTSEL